MGDSRWQLAHAFAMETARREIQSCRDISALQQLCMGLLIQNETLKDMLGDMLRP